MIRRVCLIIVLFLGIWGIMLSNIYAREVPFTQEDRERLIRVEEGLKSVNQRIDDLSKRIDDLRDLIYVVLGGMIALIGFVIWDRRTALSPVIRRYKELEERGDRIERALRELARRDERVAEVLKIVGLL